MLPACTLLALWSPVRPGVPRAFERKVPEVRDGEPDKARLAEPGRKLARDVRDAAPCPEVRPKAYSRRALRGKRAFGKDRPVCPQPWSRVKEGLRRG